MEILNHFKKKSYHFYPKNVSAIKNSDEYNSSIESLNLDRLFKEPDNLLLEKVNGLKTFLKNTYNKDVHDFTIFSWKDRAYNIQSILSKNRNVTHILCVNISILIPYYFCYVLEVAYDPTEKKLKYSPKRNIDLEKSNYLNEINEVKTFIEENLNYNEFPSHILDTKIEDISFQDIEVGDFTMFNAFFLNNFYTQIF